MEECLFDMTEIPGRLSVAKHSEAFSTHRGLFVMCICPTSIYFRCVILVPILVYT